jgi:hypothetical protein
MSQTPAPISCLTALLLASAILFFPEASVMQTAHSAEPGTDSPPMALEGLLTNVGKNEEGLLNLAEIERVLESNPHVSGFLMSVPWDLTEPESGKLHWDNLDAATSLIRSKGRYYKLLIRPGVNAPRWIYDAGAEAFETLGSNPYREDTYKKPLRIPLPWDPTYLREFGRFVHAVGTRFADDPHCAAVAITGANYQSGEVHLPKGPDDREKWEALDYQTHLPRAYERFIDLFADAFPKQRLCLHLAVAISNSDGVMEHAVEYGLKNHPDRFTLQNCQLSGRGDNMHLYSYRTIQDYVGRLRVGYQSLALLGGERQGDSQVSVYNYVRGQGEYWEVWRGNGLDPELCAWLFEEIERAREMGHAAYRNELEAAGKNFDPPERPKPSGKDQAPR